MTQLKVAVNRKKCHGHGVCGLVCPQVFSYHDDGYAYVSNENVPAEFAERVRLAAIQCPEQAIEITE
jgi:ferredoxin